MRARSIGIAGVGLAALLVSAGCTAGAVPASSLLDREQTADDRVESASPFETTAFDPESTRLLGEHDGVRFYFVIDTENQQTGGQAECLLAVGQAETDWLGLCNGGGGGGGSGIGVGSFRYDLGGGGGAQGELADGEVAVGDYVIVEGAG